jgi:cyclohexadieny/prephenate dehydrogenase
MSVGRLTVVGLGLLGGSVARVARARGLAREIVAVGRSGPGLGQARAAGAIDAATTDLAAGVNQADLVVLCAPVGTLPGLVRAAWPHLGPGSVLTDVGSVKSAVVAAADGCGAREGVAFVGGHPMAGSERSGFGASQADLFEGRLTLLTPSARSSDQAVERLRAFWEGAGSHVRLLSAELHDRAVALVSHLPHLAAYALCQAADGEALGLAGRGFGDMTRIASSAEGLWTDIVRSNREPVLDAITRYRDVLSRWETLIRQERWDQLEADLARAREVREKVQ